MSRPLTFQGNREQSTLTKPPSVYNYKDPTYIAARAESFARSGVVCQSCGRRAAVEAHHWALTYPPAEDTTANDLTALCKPCHWLITSARRYERHGGSVWGILPAFEGALESCDIKSPSMESRPSSLTTARADSTPEALPSWRSPASQRSAVPTATKRTTSDSSSSNVKTRSTSEMTESPQSRLSTLRAALDAAGRARRMQGPDDREGLVVAVHQVHLRREQVRDDRREDQDSWHQFTVPVVVQRARILRTRAKFDCPWSIEAVIDADDELVDTQKLTAWLDVAGRRIGLCDWRPQKSGTFGRFVPASVKAIK